MTGGEELEVGREAILPLVEEALRICKRRVETGRVRVSVSTETEERVIREMLRSDHVEIDRVQLDRDIAPGEATPGIRHAADGAVVIPVFEEVLVIEKRLILREEVYLRVVIAEKAEEQTMTLRRQRAEVERLPPQEGHAEHDAQGDPRP